jgi:hypothetical protein
MVSDITSAIQTNCNYLAATGLVSYTEICGRQMFFKGSPRPTNCKCFEAFLKSMGAGAALHQTVTFQGRSMRFHDVVRNGLVHEYFMKSDGGGVCLTTSNQQGRQTGFYMRGSELWFAVTPYFNLFAAALDSTAKAGKLTPWQR